MYEYLPYETKWMELEVRLSRVFENIVGAKKMTDLSRIRHKLNACMYLFLISVEKRCAEWNMNAFALIVEQTNVRNVGLSNRRRWIESN